MPREKAVVEEINNTKAALDERLGGNAHISYMPYGGEVVYAYTLNSPTKEREYCRKIRTDMYKYQEPVYGPMIICGTRNSKKEFVSLTNEQVAEYMQRFGEPNAEGTI